ncbi:MAG TPA: glycoside hydrolase family 3 N-terminal domain-containing protein [Solirubrobacteraceae bacterium]|nr:glycoside hydrolase family 3 N-terminal domain-containing protein [Solirubrobacteraceae bacterium]
MRATQTEGAAGAAKPTQARQAGTPAVASATGGSRDGPATGSTSTAASTATGDGLSVSRAVGQMLMTHVTGLTASRQLLARVRSGQVGSVILYRENINSDRQVARLTAALQRAARTGGNPPLLIGIDQEGGSVKRLYNSPPTMSAQQMGASANPFAVAESQGRATGLQLRRLGINLDFAPVADIPTTADNFLGDRAFGHNQHSVIDGAAGFAAGLAEARVAASAKHFPGLGAAGSNDTDFTLTSIDASAGRLRASYAPYLAMAQTGPAVAPLVMISDAIYPNLDPSGLPAALSSRILHRELGAAGMSDRVTITDDLEVPGVQRYPDVAVKAVLAGEDILMFAQHESSSELAYRAIMRGVTRHLIPKALVVGAGDRVLTLKQGLKLDGDHAR